MANCEITDKYLYFSPLGTTNPVVGVQVFAVPDLNSRRVDDGTAVYRVLAEHPDITSTAYRRGRVDTTSATGQFSFLLPYPAAEHPSSPTSVWSIVLPSGDIYTGTVPAVAGPLTLDDLVLSHSWTVANAVYVQPGVPGAMVRGTVAITAATGATVVFATAFSTSTYNIQLTPSLNSTTSLPPGGVAWNNKTTSGFEIVIGETFTGSVDYVCNAT